MTTHQLQTFCAIASNELLREIVAGTVCRKGGYRFYARIELERRDRVATFGA